MLSINNSSPVISDYYLDPFYDDGKDFDIGVDFNNIEMTDENREVVNILFGANCQKLRSFAVLEGLVTNPNPVRFECIDGIKITEAYDFSLGGKCNRHDAALFVKYIEENAGAYINPRELKENQTGDCDWVLTLDLEDEDCKLLGYKPLIINIKKV